MSSEQRERLFTPFTQADAGTTRQYGGTGLGLSISKRLVHMMGGEIRVESELNEGSTFFFTANFTCQPEKSAWHPGMDLDLRGKRVLVVDDNPTARTIMRTLLLSFGFVVDMVDSGKEALREIQEADSPHDKPYELVLLDWKMPEMTGIQCTLAIKSLPLDTMPKIILVTAYSREEVIEKAAETALDGFLFKPLNPSILFDTIMEAFGRRVHKKPRKTGIGSTLEKGLGRIRGARILLVEDNAINQQVARELLEKGGLSVTVVFNGREAVSAVNAGNFDLVLTDIHMPIMDGFQATARIRKNPELKDLPIVAMTAQALSGDREKSLESGMNDHITKPIDPDKLFATLVKWIRPRKGRGKPEPVSEISPPTEGTEIRDMPGMNVKEGLRRVAGNRELYGQLLHDFALEFQSFTTRLGLLMDENRLDDMAALVHGLKGVSGNLGANHLNNVAEALEKAVKRGDQVVMENQLDRLGKELKTVLHSINNVKLNAPTRKDDLDALPLEDRGTDVQAVAPLIVELKDRLEESSLDADRVLAELKGRLDGSPFQSRIQSLENELRDFEYEAALSELMELAGALGIALNERK